MLEIKMIDLVAVISHVNYFLFFLPLSAGCIDKLLLYETPLNKLIMKSPNKS